MEVAINPNALVKITRMNKIIEMQYMQKRNSKPNILKLDADRYVDLSTGELKEFKKSENRKENSNSLRQTFKRMRYLINNNFTGADNELFITLTYAENMTDPERLYLDFDKFMKRFRYYFKDKTTIDYMAIAEPQERGAWHLHILTKFNDVKKIYIPNQFDSTSKPLNAPLFELWRKGWVNIRKLGGIDDIGAYMTAYLSDIELDTDTTARLFDKNAIGVVEKVIDGQSKKVIKGGRLSLYPPGMNLYRHSRGIKKPRSVYMKYQTFDKEMESIGSAPHYVKNIEIDNDNFANTIVYKNYNLNRK